MTATTFHPNTSIPESKVIGSRVELEVAHSFCVDYLQNPAEVSCCGRSGISIRALPYDRGWIAGNTIFKGEDMCLSRAIVHVLVPFASSPMHSSLLVDTGNRSDRIFEPRIASSARQRDDRDPSDPTPHLPGEILRIHATVLYRRLRQYLQMHRLLESTHLMSNGSEKSNMRARLLLWILFIRISAPMGRSADYEWFHDGAARLALMLNATSEPGLIWLLAPFSPTQYALEDELVQVVREFVGETVTVGK